jgi:parallel beta-helix repeat protein
MKTRFLTVALLLILALVAGSGIVPVPVHAAGNTLYVNPTYNSSTPGWGTLRFDNIQSAVNASTGDTVYVYPGTYAENVTVPSSASGLTLRSLSGKALTIIDAHNADNGVKINATNVTIDGFTIKNAQVSGGGVAGIYINNVGGALIENNEISDSDFGVWVQDQAPGTTVTKNYLHDFPPADPPGSGDSGTAISFWASSSSGGFSGATVTDNTINVGQSTFTSTQSFCFFIGSDTPTAPTYDNVVVERNDCSGAGNAGFIVDNANFTTPALIAYNNVHNNYASGIWFQYASNNVNVASNTISGNDAGISNDNSTNITINDNQFSGQTGAHFGGPYDLWDYSSGVMTANNNWCNNGDACKLGGTVNGTPTASALLAVAPASQHVTQGSSAMVNIQVTASNLFGFQMVNTYDSSVLSFGSAAFGSIFDPGGFTPPAWNADGSTAGQVKFAYTQQGGSAKNPSDATLATFTLPGASVGVSAIDFNNANTILATKDGAPISSAQYGGSIYVDPQKGTVSGVVQLQGRATGSWDGMTVSLVPGGYTAMTAGDGTFSISGVPYGTYTVIAHFVPGHGGYLDAQKTGFVVNGTSNTTGTTTLAGGDADMNGTVGLGDLTITGGDFGNSPPTDVRADINGDNAVNILDLVLEGGNYGTDGPTLW